jgi:putative membrane protein
MIIGLLAIALMTQGRTVGPPVPAKPHNPVVQRTGDATALGTVGADDASEIEVAKLASTKATNGDVKKYAATLLHDHQQSLTAGTNLAKAYGITRLLPSDSAMARAHKDEMTQLNLLSGADFDRAFLRFEVDDHREGVAKINADLLEHAKRTRVKTLVRQAIAMMKAHEEAGEALLAAKP